MPSNVYNANWFAGNLVRKYPIDSMASCIDDSGNYLFDDIITDINISYPRSLGDYCYVSAVNVTEKLVSILIACGDTPIAACCVARPTAIDRYYTLDSLYDGVAGVIAIGLDSINTAGKWTFTDKSASRIAPTCCTVYDPPAVLSLSRTDDSSSLTGDILLSSGNDIELTTQYINVDNKRQKAIFIGLPLDSSVFKKYITGCEIVTEADTCSRPYAAILGGAAPSCNGSIYIRSRRDTIRIVPLTDGVLTLSTGITLQDLCPPKGVNQDDESDSASGSSSESEKDDKFCGFGSPISPNICDPSQGMHLTREVSPLITKSKQLDLSMNYINLYTSDIQIESGGAVYGDGPGFTNAEPGELVVKTEVKDAKKLDIQLIVNNLKSNYAFINIGDIDVSVDNSYVYINSYATEVDISSKSGYHIVFTPDSVLIEDENYNVVYQEEHKIDLSNEIFITINGIKCETIAYE